MKAGIVKNMHCVAGALTETWDIIRYNWKT